MTYNRLTRPVTSSDISGFNPEFWPGNENNKPHIPSKPSRMPKLADMLYGHINTDFRESEEFLYQLGELLQ